jgi:tricorn protease
MNRMVRIVPLATVMICAAIVCYAQGAKPLLMQKPTLSRTQIVFSFAGDLWAVSRNGGDAIRLTTGPGVETDPVFSPDGTQIAFTGEYDGNTDVFLIPATGGVPKRLTYHPAADEAVGWTPDGKRVMFRSVRGYPPHPRLYTVPTTGGYPTEIALPSGVDASYSPEGTKLAYVPTWQWQTAWKRYHGGQTTPIWLVDLADAKVEKIPRENSNDRDPMWIGNKIYFLSDRKGPVSLFVYDLDSKRISQVLSNSGFDIKSASAGQGAIIYEQFGSIHLYDLTTYKEKKVEIRIAGDMPEVRPHYINVGDRIEDADLSPTGARAVFGARGEIFTAPAEKGDIRNLTHTPGVNERDPSWSPDGKWIAYFSDESGEYALHLRPQDGKGDVKKINLGNPPSFFYHPLWSPDSKKICYSDKRLNLWVVDITKGTPLKVDTNPKPFFNYSPSWSPDSKWIVYTRQLKSYMSAVFVYSLDTGKSAQVMDGLSDAQFATFDKSGKYLFFTASTDLGLGVWFADMSSLGRPVTRSVYIIVLRKGQPSPLAPESDEEKPKEEKPADVSNPATPPTAESQTPVQIDMEKIGQRILALPIPARNYTALAAGRAGILFSARGAVCRLRAAVVASVRPERAQSGKNSRRCGQIRAIRQWREIALQSGTELGDHGDRRADQSGCGNAQSEPDGGLQRSARGVAADVSGGVARRARFHVRSQPARPENRRDAETIRFLSGGHRQPPGSELSVRRDAG